MLLSHTFNQDLLISPAPPASADDASICEFKGLGCMSVTLLALLTVSIGCCSPKFYDHCLCLLLVTYLLVLKKKINFSGVSSIHKKITAHLTSTAPDV